MLFAVLSPLDCQHCDTHFCSLPAGIVSTAALSSVRSQVFHGDGGWSEDVENGPQAQGNSLSCIPRCWWVFRFSDPVFSLWSQLPLAAQVGKFPYILLFLLTCVILSCLAVSFSLCLLVDVFVSLGTVTSYLFLIMSS